MSKMVVKRLGVLSIAKIYALIAGVFGLIFGVLYGLFFMFIGALASSSSRDMGGGAAIVVGLMIMIGAPIGYAIAGFIGGALWAAIYNVVAKFTGGVEMELEAAAPGYGSGYGAPPPPPPQQWNQYGTPR